MRGPVRARGLVTGCGLLVTVLAVAGCGGDDGPPASTPSETPALWNPCDGLDPQLVGRALGVPASEQAGSETAPDCRYTPDRDGGPVLEAGYALFGAGLDEAWRTMGDFRGSEVSRPDVPRADDARLVVREDDGQLYVSGFVQNSDLIQTTNIVDPAPFDRRRLARGTLTVLGALSAYADEQDAGRAAPTDGG